MRLSGPQGLPIKEVDNLPGVVSYCLKRLENPNYNQTYLALTPETPYCPSRRKLAETSSLLALDGDGKVLPPAQRTIYPLL